MATILAVVLGMAPQDQPAPTPQTLVLTTRARLLPVRSADRV
jgi:hypothetical protein